MNSKTMYDFLKRRAEENPDDIFLSDCSHAYTFRQFLALVEKRRSQLFSYLKEGNFIALKANRSILTCQLLFALLSLNQKVLLCDPHERILDYLKDKIDFQVEFKLTNEETNMDIQSEDGFCLYVKDKKIPLEELEDNVPCLFEKDTSQEGNLIIFTSGSTGKSKAIMQKESSFISNAFDTLNLGGYSKDDINMLMIPLNHVFGLALLFIALVLKHQVTFPKNASLEEICSTIEKKKVTRMNGVTALYLSLANEVKNNRYDLSSLRYGFIGGAPWTKEQFAFIEETLKITLIPVYGMSEFIGISCSSYKESREERAGCVGKSYSKTHIFLDENEEILIKGEAMMKGYLSNEEFLDANGYFHTGDIGCFDKEERLHLKGRIKDFINRGGEKIAPLKIEQALLSLSYVKEAAVIAKNDDKFGQVPLAILVLKEKKEENQIKKDLLEKLSKHEIPQSYVFLDKLPLNNNNKVDKVTLKELYS